jgi:Reverse transcriptase (RNA-dependent DNA polymerase)
VNFILDADVASFFDSVSKEKLVRFVEHRVGDPRIIRLIQKWLKAGVLEDGVVTVNESGTGQGSVVSPLLANALPSHTQGGSRVREFRSRGSVRGAVGNDRPLYVAGCLVNKHDC